MYKTELISAWTAAMGEIDRDTIPGSAERARKYSDCLVKLQDKLPIP